MLKLEKALAALQRLVASGQEFPDAACYVCKEYNVKMDPLREAYDEACCQPVVRQPAVEVTGPRQEPRTTFARGLGVPWKFYGAVAPSKEVAI